GAITRLRGDYDGAMEWNERAIQAARSIADFLPFALAMPLSQLGSVCLEVSEKLAGRTAELHAETLQILEKPGGEAAGAIAWVEFGYTALAQGELDRAAEYFERAMTSQSPQKLLQRPLMLTGKAFVALARNRPDEAAALVGEARRYAEERAMKYMYP